MRVEGGAEVIAADVEMDKRPDEAGLSALARREVVVEGFLDVPATAGYGSGPRLIKSGNCRFMVITPLRAGVAEAVEQGPHGNDGDEAEP